jgi:hypothetical protein
MGFAVNTAVAVFGDTVYFPTAAVTPVAVPSPISFGQTYSFLNTPNGVFIGYGLMQNGFGIWEVNPSAGTVTKITSAGVPTSLLYIVPGIVVLDGTYYVMSQALYVAGVSGGIFGSNLNDPTTWTALNLIQWDQTLGVGTTISRHLNYVVAFCENGIQFFFDNGNPPPGSPLSPVPNATFQTGCIDPYSIAHMNEATIFVGVVNGVGRGVFVFQGLSMTKLSTTAIDKILQTVPFSGTLAGTFLSAYTAKVAGHSLYVLNVITGPNNYSTIGYTLVYDMDFQHWTVWSSATTGGFGNIFTGFYGVVDQSTYLTLVQGFLDGHVYYLGQNVYQDAGSHAITMQIQTDPRDAGTMKRKYASALTVLGDTVSDNLMVSYSDDDYNTFSTPVALAMGYIRKQIRRLGSFRRRAWRFTYTGNQPMRIDSFIVGDIQE